MLAPDDVQKPMRTPLQGVRAFMMGATIEARADPT